ncbi:MAG TPA: hypothetical protein VGI65_14080 [Steroidobacteraceae bacterium]|jgi:hypothetical protein
MKASAETQRAIEAFFASYSAAYWRNDLDSIVVCFVYPCHFVSDGDPVSLIPIASEQDCRRAVERVLGWHRDIGAVSSKATELIVTELSPRVASVSLKSDFFDDVRRRLYDFQGIYTLVRTLHVWKIAAISHNQIPRLVSCVSQTKVP